MNRPIIAITMGDPAGIGPEITAKALNRPELYQICRPLLIGDRSMMELALRTTGLTLKLHTVQTPADGLYEYGTIDLLDLGVMDGKPFAYGRVSAACGGAAYFYVEQAIRLAMEHSVDATVTNPLNKEALNLAGYHYSGHTEIYADLTGTKRYCMLLMDGDMMISHVSTHVSLMEACRRVQKGRILEVVSLTTEAVKKLTGRSKPRIAVAGLNPHCGENGLFGTEEAEQIQPAITEAIASGYDIEGPVPPDTLFSKLRGGWYDAAVAMYHDQGHIPLKVIGFTYNHKAKKWDSISGVNITLGLPIIRTSVDHGTAFDQAGTGQADETSLINAIEAAVKLSV